MSNSKTVLQWQESMMSTYATPTLSLAHGEGARVWDEDGKAYVDFVGGIAVNSLGHAHPAVIEAVTQQVRKLAHVSNLYANEQGVRLAERLLDLCGERGVSGKVFFCNSGAEAAEAAFKIARKTGRPNMVSAEGAFHGRTMAALALTGQPAKQAGFAPLPGPVVHVPYGDVDALAAVVDENTAAVFLEPVQGEGGVIPAPPDYLLAARDICDRTGALLVLDEVQTGVGRTGAWFAHEWDRIEPDVVLLAKGLGAGLPIGACMAFGNAATLLQPGEHGSTFGGNPIACAAAHAVLDELSGGLLGWVGAMGRKLAIGIEDLHHPLIAGVRGRGLLLGIVLRDTKAGRVQSLVQDRGYLVNAVAPNVVRLAPPLVITEDDIDGFLETLPGVLDEAMT